MAKRRFQGWGKPYWTGKKSNKYGEIQMYKSGSWKIRFYDKGAISTFRLTRISGKKR